jgi:hypothetical protein
MALPQVMTPDDRSLEARLHQLGTPAIDPALVSVHLGAMAGVAPGRAGILTKFRVAAAFFAGLLIGGSGLAAAGALPASVQSIAHTTFAKVGVNVPAGHDRVTEGCGTDTNGQPFKNHGQYVKAHKGDSAAAQSDCGKPKVSVHDSTSNPGNDENDSTSNSNCAGQGPVTPPSAAANSQGAAQGKADAGSECKDATDATVSPGAPSASSNSSGGATTTSHPGNGNANGHSTTTTAPPGSSANKNANATSHGAQP